MSALIDRVRDEADLCRNDGANDIAALLDEVRAALAAAEAQPSEPVAAQMSSVAHRKTADLLAEGYSVVGYVLANEGARTAVQIDAAVRWLTPDEQHRLMFVEGSLAAPVAQPVVPQSLAVPACHVAAIGHRWDSERQQHVPQVLVEFDPVPANSPNDAKGWKDRDALAAILAAAPAAPAAQPLTDEQLDALRQADTGALNFVTLRQFRAVARAIEKAHGIGGAA